jgi:hypothetical protein
LLSDQRATIRQVLNLSCVFLAHSFGYISPFPYTICPKARYQRIPISFTYYSYHNYLYTKFDFPLSRDQTTISRICRMMHEKFKCGTFEAALDDVRLRLVMNTRIVVKCLRNILIPCFGANCILGNDKNNEQ